MSAAAVGAYIGAAYWFTSSTSFANPAVTIGRMFTDTFAGIAPASVPVFIGAQIVGASSASVWSATCSPTPPHRRPGRRPHAMPPRHQRKRLMTVTKPSVLFVCVHNAGRSQMAAAFLTHLSARRQVEVRSAGSEPAEQVNPAAVQAMAEVGIDIAAEKPKILTDQAVRESDVVITMGCGDTCPFYPGKRYEDWVLDDPAGKGVDAVRPIRDEIRDRVETLIGELLPHRAADAGPA